MNSQSADRELLELTRRLLDCIAAGDWETYTRLCDPGLTCFEPEGCGHMVEGLDFHRFYFDLAGHSGPRNTTIVSPRVRIWQDGGVVTYVRLVQCVDDQGHPTTSAFEETRVWQRQPDGWRHVHFHRSQLG